MPKIEFRNNKILKLENVLSKKIPEKEIFFHGKQVTLLKNWVIAKGYKTKGPLIIFSKIKGFSNDGKPLIDSRIMIQLEEDNIQLESPYDFENLIRLENCLLARFEDNAGKIQFATMKLQLFAYENDIELTGETYIVIINEEEDKTLADVIMPVKVNGNE